VQAETPAALSRTPRSWTPSTLIQRCARRREPGKPPRSRRLRARVPGGIVEDLGDGDRRVRGFGAGDERAGGRPAFRATRRLRFLTCRHSSTPLRSCTGRRGLLEGSRPSRQASSAMRGREVSRCRTPWRRSRGSSEQHEREREAGARAGGVGEDRRRAEARPTATFSRISSHIVTIETPATTIPQKVVSGHGPAPGSRPRSARARRQQVERRPVTRSAVLSKASAPSRRARAQPPHQVPDADAGDDLDERVHAEAEERDRLVRSPKPTIPPPRGGCRRS